MQAKIVITLDQERVLALYEEWMATGGPMLFSTWLEGHLLGAVEDLTAPFGGSAEVKVIKLQLEHNELTALIKAGKERRGR